MKVFNIIFFFFSIFMYDCVYLIYEFNVFLFCYFALVIGFCQSWLWEKFI